MPVPKDFMPFFTGLVDKSRRSEIHWEATAHPNAHRVRFPDFSIVVSEEGGSPPSIRVELINDRGEPTAVLRIDNRDDQWLGAVGLFNSADRRVRKLGRTLHRAMEELGKRGPVGLKASSS